MNRAVVVGLTLAFLGPVWAQDRDSVSELRRQAETDPAGALAALERLASAGASHTVRVEAARARADVLRAQGRVPEAQAVWRGLLSAGVDVTAELLELSGAQLTLSAPEDLAPGEAATVGLRAKGTGPLTARLYAVDTARWRQASARAPERGLFAHLRAPPPASLRKLSEWRVANPEGAAELRTPVPLERGLYLLTVSARGVAVPQPLVVSGARAVVRRGAGRGLVFLARRVDGEPLGGVELTGHDARGLPVGNLGRTSDDGLLRYGGDPVLATGWTSAGLLVARLLPSVPEPAPPGPRVRTDLPHYRAGDTVRVEVSGAVGEQVLRLIDLGQVPVATVRKKPRRGGGLRAAFVLPETARGRWGLEVSAADGGATTRIPLRVTRGPAPVAVELTVPDAVAESSLEVKARAVLRASRLPVNGVLRWWLLATPAELSWSHHGVRPRPRYAARSGGPQRQLAAGRETLSGGEAGWTISLPAFEGVHSLRLEAWLEGPASHAVGVAELVAGPRPVVVAAIPERSVVAPRNVVRVRLCAAQLDGRPAPRTDLVFTHGPRGGKAEPPRRLRTDAEGVAWTSLAPSGSGAIDMRVSAGEGAQDGTATLWVADDSTALDPAPARLLVDRGAGRALAVLPVVGGSAVVTREGARIEDAQVVPLKGAGIVLRPPDAAGGRRLVVSAVRDGALHTVSRDWPRGVEPLSVEAKPRSPIALPGDDLVVTVQTADALGAGRAATLALDLYPEATARALDRRAEEEEAPGQHAVRGPGQAPEEPPADEGGRPIFEDLRAVGHVDERSNGAGKGLLRVRLPQRPGRYWARVVGSDAEGRRGVAWCAVQVTAPLLLDVDGPGHLVAGDKSQVALRVRARGAGALLPEAAVRVSWRGVGVRVDAPKIAGARALLEGDPGADTVRVAADEEARLVFALEASEPGAARVELSVSLEGDPAPPRTLTVPVVVSPAGLSHVRDWTGRVEPKKSVWLRLALPDDAAVDQSSLRLSVDPDVLTPCLAAYDDLARSRARLRAPVQRHVIAPALRTLLAARKVQRPLAEPSDWEQVLARLSAVRDAQLRWGPATGSVLLWLLRARRAGLAVPVGLVDPALNRLGEGPRERWLRALAGRVEDEVPGNDARARLYLALTREAAGRDPGPALVVATLARELLDPVERAELLRLLASRGADPEVVDELVDELLLARSGPGWRDPDLAGAATLALIEVAKRAPERKGSRLEAFLESKQLLDTFSGGGLAEWQGVAEASAVRNRSRLRVRSRGGDPLFYAARLQSFVRRPKAEALAKSLRVTRIVRPFQGEAAGPVLRVKAGQRLRVQLDVHVLDGAAPDRALIELPLPGGCELLQAPPGLHLEGGVLRGELVHEQVVVVLQAVRPGDYTILGARVQSLRDPARIGTTPALDLVIESP